MQVLTHHKEQTQYGTIGRIAWLQKPTRRSIEICNFGRNGESQRFFLSFPAIIFISSYVLDDSGYCSSDLVAGFVFDNPINLETIVYRTLLPNDQSFNICLGDDIEAQSIEEFIEKNTNAFWSTIFDFYELDVRLLPAMNYKQFIAQWDEKTKANPKWIPKEQFQEGSFLFEILTWNHFPIKEIKVDENGNF